MASSSPPRRWQWYCGNHWFKSIRTRRWAVADEAAVTNRRVYPTHSHCCAFAHLPEDEEGEKEGQSFFFQNGNWNLLDVSGLPSPNDVFYAAFGTYRPTTREKREGTAYVVFFPASLFIFFPCDFCDQSSTTSFVVIPTIFFWIVASTIFSTQLNGIFFNVLALWDPPAAAAAVANFFLRRPFTLACTVLVVESDVMRCDPAAAAFVAYIQ